MKKVIGDQVSVNSISSKQEKEEMERGKALFYYFMGIET